MLNLFNLTQQQLQALPVFGLIGNFADHLAQAGEDANFANFPNATAQADAPKGIFPIYLPNHPSFLGTYPLSHDKLVANFNQPQTIQAEAELCMLFDIEYQAQQIQQLQPVGFTAFNDCSIRNSDTGKLSKKKNWGTDSTGVSETWIACRDFVPGQPLDHYQLSSWIRREGQWQAYGEQSPVTSYQYFHQTLQQWILDTFNQQTDVGPVENLQQLLAETGYPKQMIVAFGATRYRLLGEASYLRPNDEVLICLSPKDQMIQADHIDQICQQESVLCLRQTVENRQKEDTNGVKP